MNVCGPNEEPTANPRLISTALEPPLPPWSFQGGGAGASAKPCPLGPSRGIGPWKDLITLVKYKRTVFLIINRNK